MPESVRVNPMRVDRIPFHQFGLITNDPFLDGNLIRYCMAGDVIEPFVPVALVPDAAHPDLLRALVITPESTMPVAGIWDSVNRTIAVGQFFWLTIQGEVLSNVPLAIAYKPFEKDDIYAGYDSRGKPVPDR